MATALTLKEWSEGANPDKNDVASWSNLVFQRALQVENPREDSLSEYFFSQWLHADKTKDSVAPLFERTFSAYGVGFQISLMNKLVEDHVLRPVDLLDKTVGRGMLHRHLLQLPEVWQEMDKNQQRDNFFFSFSELLRAKEQAPGTTHPAWIALESFKDPKERAVFFNEIVGSKIYNEFGFFNDEKQRFPTSVFHQVLSQISETWGVHHAQVMYGLLKRDPASQRDYDRYSEFIEPYANDVRELIQFSTNPRDERIRRQLPNSDKPLTVDMVFAFAIAADPTNLFWDRRHVPVIEHDEDAAQALSSAF